MKSLSAAILLLMCGSLHAYAVQEDTTGNAIGITGIEISGTFYDVSWTSNLGSNPFFGSRSEATIATHVINSALNSHSGITTVGGSPFWLLKVDLHGSVLSSVGAYPGPDWDFYGTTAGAFGPPASFSVSAVPIPAAVWLFGSGLGLLGWFRKTKT